jgi:hypothetical protein
VSVKAMTWAFVQKTGSPSAKSVLLALADYADEYGWCWPSQRTIADRSEQSIDSVQRRLADLERSGFISRQMRKRTNGGRTTDGYTLLMNSMRKHGRDSPTSDCCAPHSNDAVPPAADCGAPHSHGAVPPAAAVREPIEPSLEPSTDPSLHPSTERPPKPPDGGQRDASSALGKQLEKGRARSEAFGPSAAEKSVRRRTSKARIVLADDGRDHFNRDTAYEARVENIIVTGAHAEMALESARKIYLATEPMDIATALVEASGQFNKPAKSDTKPADLDAVLNWAAEAAARAVAIRRQGAPERHSSGSAGRMFFQTYKHPWCYLAQPFLDGLCEKYPAAIEDTQGRRDLFREFRRIVDAADKNMYGVELQRFVEAEFERHVDEVHRERLAERSGVREAGPQSSTGVAP